MCATCPVCESTNHYYLRRVFVSPDVPEAFHLLDRSFFLACRRCGTVFMYPPRVEAPQVSQDQTSSSYYRQMAAERDVAEEVVKAHVHHIQEPKYKTCLKFLQAHVDPAAHTRWLDIGSSGVPTAFPDFQFTTIETDPVAVRIGQNLYKKERIFCSTYEDFQSAQPFDGVLFHHSLYCMANPAAMLRKTFELLRPHGLLLVAISDFFMETTSTQDDGQFLRIEDVLRGDVMRVYFNRHSLEYLCNRLGFRLLRQDVMQHVRSNGEPWVSSRYMLFTRVENHADIQPDPDGLSASMRLCTSLTARLQNDLERITSESLAAFNRPDCYWVGDRELLFELSRFSPLDRITWAVDWDLPELSGTEIQGLHFGPMAEIPDEPDTVVIVASFLRAQQIEAVLRARLKQATFWLPTRRSALPGMRLANWGLSKALKFQQAP